MEVVELVNKAQRGEDNAFYELVEGKKQMLYRTAFFYTGSEEDALDIVQETIYKAYISIKKLKEPQFFSTWLTRILINASMDFLRKKKKVVIFESLEDKGSEHSEFSEEIIDLRRAVCKLDNKYKTVVILKYFQDHTLKEISEIMECPLGTVKTYLHKALKELKIEMGEVES